MNESISRAAGTQHGQEFPPEQMDALIASLGRTPRQRTTLYGMPRQTAAHASYGAPALAPLVLPHSAREPVRARPWQADRHAEPKRNASPCSAAPARKARGLALRWAHAGHAW